MENPTTEETQENPGAEETPETPVATESNEAPVETPEPKVELTDEKPLVETETPKEKTDEEKYSERERASYARMKKAEEEAKQAKADLAQSHKPISEVDKILEVQYATKDLDPSEIEELKVRADANKISLSDARKNENFLLWQKAYQDKVGKEAVPPPSTNQTVSEQPKSVTERLQEAKTIEEKEAILTASGLYKNPNPRSKQRIDFEDFKK